MIKFITQKLRFAFLEKRKSKNSNAQTRRTRVKHIARKLLIHRIYKELFNDSKKKIKPSHGKMSKDHKHAFHTRRKWWVNA